MKLNRTNKCEKQGEELATLYKVKAFNYSTVNFADNGQIGSL